LKNLQTISYMITFIYQQPHLPQVACTVTFVINFYNQIQPILFVFFFYFTDPVQIMSDSVKTKLCKQRLNIFINGIYLPLYYN